MDFFGGIADWLYGLWIDLLNWFSHTISMFTTWINETWAWIVSPLYRPVSDFLPSIPELRAVPGYVFDSGIVTWVGVFWWIMDQVVVAGVVVPLLGVLAGFMLAVWLYRAWLLIKNAVPFA